jgi:hypothetical protein
MEYEIKAEQLYELIKKQDELIAKLQDMVDNSGDYDRDYHEIWIELQQIKHQIERDFEPAKEMLKNGINDGRYADIWDGINVDTENLFFKAVVQFAEDYAEQFKFINKEI